MSSFIFSAMSKSAGGRVEGEGAVGGGAFDIDFLTASDFAFDGDIFALMLEGDRGISGDTALDNGAILKGCLKRDVARKFLCVAHMNGGKLLLRVYLYARSRPNSVLLSGSD
jgi:hypothetical protein